MKKRILALALAGTTAFSVFGAAMSANAAVVTYPTNSTTDTVHSIDAYVSYDNVAKTIYASAKTKASTKTDYYYRTATGGEIAPATPTAKAGSYDALVAYAKTLGNVAENYTKYTAIGKMSDGNPLYMSEDGTKVFGTANGTPVTDVDTTISYHLGINKVTGNVSDEYKGKTYTYKGKYYGTLAEAIADAQKDAGYTSANPAPVQYYLNDTTRYNTKAEYENATKDYATVDAWLKNTTNWYTISSPVNATGKDIVAVSKTANDYTTDPAVGNYTDWKFSSDMTGESEISIAKVTTTINTTTGKLDSTKVDDDTVFAYDFLPANVTVSSAGTIGANWNDKNDAGTAASIAKAGEDIVLKAETGRGRENVGIRYDVVTNWIDFLDELSIDNGYGYVETEAEFISNYTDLFYNDPYYSRYNGQLIGYEKVDLYNLTELLKDIYALRTATAYENANTSELIYLMQQYDKYIGNYIDKSEVETSDWGELMLSVLNAVTEDDFKNRKDYKKYVNRVEELEDAYADATSKAQIAKAEQGMYDLLTSVPYTAASVSKTELNATMSGLYFNAKYAPATYTTAPSTIKADMALYTNYNYYVAAGVRDTKPTAVDNNFAWTWTTKYGAGYYSLYPMDDYIDWDYTTKNYAYTGNKDADDFVGAPATAEYEWFWNVYQLAVNMSKNNKYQGAIDAIDAALNEAVEALAPTTTPYATEVSALDEMVDEYAGKIESDYNAGYYGMYTAANAFADVAEGKYQTRVAREIVNVAGEALTYQGTQVTVTKNDIKALKDSIKDGQTALKTIKEDKNYNAAQVNELNKAIAAAQAIVDKYEGIASTLTSEQSVNKVYSKLVGDKDQFVKSDLEAAKEAIADAIKGSTVVQGWYNNGTAWQYGEGDNYLNDGWHFIDKVWYYFDEDATAKQSEWLNLDGKWYWFNSNCGAAIGWAKVDNEWYYFGGDNAMKTGWVKVDGNWYYLAASGKMTTGWVQVGGKWYYMSKESNSLGQMLANTTVEGYKLGADGAMIEK